MARCIIIYIPPPSSRPPFNFSIKSQNMEPAVATDHVHASSVTAHSTESGTTVNLVIHTTGPGPFTININLVNGAPPAPVKTSFSTVTVVKPNSRTGPLSSKIGHAPSPCPSDSATESDPEFDEFVAEMTRIRAAPKVSTKRKSDSSSRNENVGSPPHKHLRKA